MINTALVGFGYAATTFHLPFLNAHPHFTVTHVVTSNPQKVSSTLSGVSCESSLAELLELNADLDLVIITTPNHMHFEQASMCIEHGINVLIEKPAVISEQQARDLKKLSENRGVKITTYQNRRYDGDFLTIKRLIDEGKLKDIKVFESRFDRFRPEVRQRWREQAGEGAGIVFDLAPHLIDQALQLFGKPHSVTANCLPLRDGATSIDYFDATLMYSDKVVKLASSPYCAGEITRFNIQTPFGAYRKLGLDKQEAALKQGYSPSDKHWETKTTEDSGYFYTGDTAVEVDTHRGNYMAFYDQLHDALIGKRVMPVPMADIVTQMQILEAIIKSSETHATIEL